MSRKTIKAARAKRRIKHRTEKNAEARNGSVEEAPPKLERARYITQLELLLSRGNITDKQYEAGDRFYKDWRRGGGEPRLIAGYEGDTVRCVNGGYSEYQVAAQFRFEQALKRVSLGHKDVVIHVCLLDMKLADWGDPRAGALLLREGLDELHYYYDGPRRNEGLDDAKTEVLLLV